MSPGPRRKPTFRVLRKAECEAMLTRHHVGRLAYSFRDRVDIEPIGYVYARGALVFRTAPGFKLQVLARRPWVALEIDEVAGAFDWRSVVVYGTAYVLKARGSDAEVRAHRAAVSSLRRLVPGTFHKGDPVPFRSVVVKVYIDRVAGRAARTKPAAASRRVR
jgi:nitroimidazol reductase NimA-like FMN-containing flavoprotein (pyridoxamine 5'-phosphate oxidase superfamily)